MFTVEGMGICLVAYLRFLVPTVLVLLAVHCLLPVPREVFRKLLHMVAFLSTPVVMQAGTTWPNVVGLLVTFGAAVWPILLFAERFSWYADLFVQRRPHEVRRSLLLLFWGDAALVWLCWGVCGRPEVAVAAILMWGFGDAAAALVGKRFGRHHVTLPLADTHKTWEGSAAMCVVSLVVGVATMGMSLPVVIAAVAGAYVELITHGGYDTVSVPAAVAAVLLLLA